MDKKTLKMILVASTSIVVALLVSFIVIICYGNKEVENNEDIINVEDKSLILDGWIGLEKVDVRSEPSKSGEVIGQLSFNDKIQYEMYDGSWLLIQYEDNDAYIPYKNILDKDVGHNSYEQYVLDEIIGYKSYSVPSSNGFKSFMDYRTITDRSSNQYKLQNLYAKTGDYGIRMVDDRYCIAVGSHFTDNIGQYVDLILENGTVIPCILADQKADVDTDYNNITTMHNGCVSEFVVDISSLNSAAKRDGNISSCKKEWDSPVIEVKVYNKNVFSK